MVCGRSSRACLNEGHARRRGEAGREAHIYEGLKGLASMKATPEDVAKTVRPYLHAWSQPQAPQ